MEVFGIHTFQRRSALCARFLGAAQPGRGLLCAESPELPRTIDPRRTGRIRGVRFFLRQEGHIAHRPGGRLDPSVDLSIDRSEHRLAKRRADDGHAMAAHQHKRVVSKSGGEITSEFGRADKEVASLAGVNADLEYGRSALDEAAHVTDRTKPCACHYGEGQDGNGMTVNHRQDVGPHAVDLAMDEPFEIGRLVLSIGDVAIKIEGQDVLDGNERGGTIAREQEAVGPKRMPDADMTEAIDDPAIEQDMIGGHEFRDSVLKSYSIVHFKFPHLATSKGFSWRNTELLRVVVKTKRSRTRLGSIRNLDRADD
jgi:hypothetical protein